MSEFLLPVLVMLIGAPVLLMLLPERRGQGLSKPVVKDIAARTVGVLVGAVVLAVAVYFVLSQKSGR